MNNPDIVILGRKIRLRNKQDSDAEDDYRWRVDPELAELDATTPLRMDYSDFVRMYKGELRFPSFNMRRYAIDTYEDIHIGNCMLYDINTFAGESEIGIMVGNRDYWGRGYGLDAMAHLLESSFQDMNLEKIYLHTLDWNLRARKSFGKCGFSEVRSVRRFGRAFVRMEITSAKWEDFRLGLVDVKQRN
jgi:RimJ/RimL family protein N-acetyltransferase